MDIGVYWQYLEQLVKEAMENSDRSNDGISNYLWSKKKPGRLTRNRVEKAKALDEARRAFAEHRHWPLEVVLSHLGINSKNLES